MAIYVGVMIGGFSGYVARQSKSRLAVGVRSGWYRWRCVLDPL